MKSVFCENILNVISEFAWNLRVDLEFEINQLIAFRECIPTSILKFTVDYSDGRYGECLNPWYRGMPYFPLELITDDPPFKQVLMNLHRWFEFNTWMRLRTYRAVFARHLHQFFNGSSEAWGKILVLLNSLPVGCAELDFLPDCPTNPLQQLLSEFEEAQLLPGYFSPPWRVSSKASS